jgi:hypothetical protein
MKITFAITDSTNKMHLIQHDTGSIKRESFASKTQINVEREWLRFLEARPDVVQRFTPEKNPLDTRDASWHLSPQLHLVGAIQGAVEWYGGLEKEPWEEEIIA